MNSWLAFIIGFVLGEVLLFIILLLCYVGNNKGGDSK